MGNDRRNFLKTMAASVIAPGVAAATVAHESFAPKIQRKSARPNVLLMICDDLGYGDLGCYGSKIPTPHLDRLSAQGTRCMRYNSAHPICSASRAALLTGRYAQRSHTAGALFPHAKGTDLNEQTLANLFQDAGYRTHAIGKWHLGDVGGYWPTDRGFDSYLGVPYSDDMQPLPLMQNTMALEADTDRDELTPRYTEEALKLLNTQSKEPFFLYLAYSYPHDPARGSKNFRGRSKFGPYGDAVEEIDWSVGRILDALEKRGEADNTVVIFTSDHGPWFQGSTGQMRGRKGSTFEGGVRVPFIVRWPGHVPSSTVCTEWLGHLNVLPTLANWCGLQMPRLPVDGFDASATWLHREPSPAKPVLYFTPTASGSIHCIRSGPWKLRIAQSDGQIYINDRPGSTANYLLAKPELYNLDADPSEAYDVAHAHPDLIAQLSAEIEKEISTFPEETRQLHTALKSKIASVVTPPGAAARVQTGPLPAWAWEPEDRRG